MIKKQINTQKDDAASSLPLVPILLNEHKKIKSPAHTELQGLNQPNFHSPQWMSSRQPMNHSWHEALNCFLCFFYMPTRSEQHQGRLRLALSRALTLMRLQCCCTAAPLEAKLRTSFCLNTLAKYSNIHRLTCTFSLNLACHLGVDGSSRLLKTAVLKALPFPCPQNKTPAMPAPLVYLNPTQPNS